CWFLVRLGWPRPGMNPVPVWQTAGTWSLILLLGVVGSCLPKTVHRLHAARAGNRVVGLWLAGQVRDGDVIDDDHYWSHFYSGLIFAENRTLVLPPDARPWCYTVQTRTKEQPLKEA